ncbi:hypothetical protein ACJW31_01G313900 [Castanea mollissima]
MAESPPPPNKATKEELLSQSVQELVINGGQPPDNYVYKNSTGGVPDVHTPLNEIPVIDLGNLKSSATTVEEELEKLRSALSSWGCFQAINHGMTSSFLDEVHEVTMQFFSLPMDEKLKYSREANNIEGYGNDIIFSDNQILDWTDRLILKVSPEDQRKFTFWPNNPTDFRDILLKYTMELNLITEVILKAMAKSLNLEDNCFLGQMGERSTMLTRFNLYPPCPRPDLVLGLKPHADGSAITFVLQDREVEGLQFLKDNQWIRVPVIPHALLINIGDQAEIMSNGIFKSPVHRVVTNSERERISVAVFCSPDSDIEIEPIGRLVNDSRPRLYKKVKNYVDTYFQYYQQGKRPIDAVRY